jgi:hypothetical protein
VPLFTLRYVSNPLAACVRLPLSSVFGPKIFSGIIPAKSLAGEADRGGHPMTKETLVYTGWALSMALFVHGNSYGQAAGYPFGDGFESGTLGPQWAVVGIGVVSDEAAAARIETRGVRIENEILTLHADSGAAAGANCWVLLHVKPVPNDDAFGEPDPGTSAGGFYVNSAGQLKARSGANWVPVGTVGVGQWMRVAMHLDFTAERRAPA